MTPDARLLVRARNRSVAVAAGLIVDGDPPFDLVLDFPDADVRPGLINSHDHLHRNHYGRLGSPPYRNAYEWADDIQESHAARIAAGRRLSRRDALLAGALKNLSAGVTSVVHHDRWEAEFDRHFPLRVVRLPVADSLGMTEDLSFLDGAERFALHVAEGVDDRAAGEIELLADKGLLRPGLLAVHGVAIGGPGIDRFESSGAALVWCPSSNLFLFRQTASDGLLNSGVDVLLGSDSLLTADGDLLDELRCARRLGSLDDWLLEDAVGMTAARRLGLPVPSLEVGGRADLVIMTRPLLEASAADVMMVMVDGIVRLLAPNLRQDFECGLPEGRLVRIGALERWIDS